MPFILPMHSLRDFCSFFKYYTERLEEAKRRSKKEMTGGYFEGDDSAK